MHTSHGNRAHVCHQITHLEVSKPNRATPIVVYSLWMPRCCSMLWNTNRTIGGEVSIWCCVRNAMVAIREAIPSAAASVGGNPVFCINPLCTATKSGGDCSPDLLLPGSTWYAGFIWELSCAKKASAAAEPTIAACCEAIDSSTLGEPLLSGCVWLFCCAFSSTGNIPSLLADSLTRRQGLSDIVATRELHLSESS